MNYKFWKGKNFEETKLLVVGESFYSGDLDVDKKLNDELLCIKMINEVIDLSHVSKTHKNLQKVLEGSYIEKNQSFYDKIAYHQLVQRPMKTIEERPTREDYIEGFKTLFSTVIPELKPNKILFLGVGSVNVGLTSFSKLRPELNLVPVNCGEKVGRSYPRNKSINVEGNDVELLWISHPGMAFNSLKWRSKLSDKYADYLV